MVRIPVFLLAWCFVGWQLTLLAQELPHVRHFTPSDYHAQNQNWAIAQDNNQHVYFGNANGLLEFDGVHWIQHRLTGVVRSVAAAPDGKIYVGCFGDFGFFKRNQGRMDFTSLANELDFPLLKKEEIWHILVTDQAVYFQSFSTIYKYQKGKIEVLVPPSSIMFMQHVLGRNLLQSINNELFELHPDGRFLKIAGTENLKGKVVQGIVSLEDNKILIGTRDHGLFTLVGQNLSVWNTPINTLLGQAQMNKIIRLTNGNYAIGTILNGVWVINAQGQVLDHFNRELGLQNNTVLALFEDSMHNLWVGLDKGIDYLVIGSLARYYTDPQGITGTPYTALITGQRMYLGTNQGVFQRPLYQKQTPFTLIPGTQGQTWQLFQAGNHIYCGHNQGLYYIPEKGAIELISPITGAWQTIPWRGRPGWWLQGTYTGLVAFSTNSQGKLVLKGRVANYQEPISSLAFDQHGALWVTNPNSGLQKLSISHPDSMVINHRQQVDSLLPPDLKSRALRLFVHQDTVLVQSADARYTLLLLREQLPKFVLLDSAETCTALQSVAGLSIMHIGQKTEITFGKSSVQIPYRFPSFYAFGLSDEDGHWYFGHESGYVRLPEGLTDTAKALLPKVFALVADTDTIYLDDKPIGIPANVKSISAIFNLQDFAHQPVFWYRIPGYLDNWIQTQNGICVLGKLPHGKYALQVHSGKLNEMISMSFQVLTPWYLEWWMYACYGIILLIGFWYLEKYQQRRLEQQKHKLEQEKEIELQQQRSVLERQRLEEEVARTNRELSSATFNLIRKNEMLQKIKDDLHAAQTNATTVEKVMRQVDYHIEAEHDWEVFQAAFNQIHNDFFKRLQTDFPELTPGDLRLCAYLRLNLSSKEIAPLFNISLRGVENKRYRLRQRLGLADDANLVAWLLSY